MRHLITLLLLLAVHPAPAANPPAASARVESFSPLGTAKGVRQVSARFSAPMVALGDPRLPPPFDIQCPAGGTGRWADPRTWVLDFDRDLAAGVSCRFVLRTDARSLDGQVLSGARDFEFNTGGPALTGSLPQEGSAAIDEHQVFLLAVDAPVDPASLAAHAYCEVSGLKERIEVDVLDGEAREKVLNQARKLDYDYAALLVPEDAEAGLKLQGEARRQAESRLLALRCRRSLPPDTEARLVWGKGIRTASGLETTQDRVLDFRTRPAFTARLRCQRVNPQAGCLPMLPLELIFSAHVAAGQLNSVRLVDDTGKIYPAEPVDPAVQPLEDRLKFRGPFPEMSQLLIELPADLADDAGRPLENVSRFPLPVRIDEYPPLAKFPADFGIIERKTGGILPVTLRNLEPRVAGRQLVVEAPDGVPGQVRRVTENDAEIVQWLRRVKEAGEPRGEWVKPPNGKDDSTVWREDTGSRSVFGPGERTTAITVPRPLGEKEFEVIGIPLTDAGFYVVELSSPRLGASLLGDQRIRHVATAALVTNLGVHFKWGREGSMVWVTTLDRAEPVAGARIQVSDQCGGKLLWQGETGADGLARVPAGSLGKPHAGTDCYEGSPAPLFVSARVGEDLGFTSSGWNRGIQPADFNLSTGDYQGPEIVHTVLDRPLFRAGETVSMKHFLRRHTLEGFDLPPGFKPAQVEITHLGSDQAFRLPLTLDDRGIGESTWTIPREARLGAYQVSLTDARQEQRFESARFHVEQFRLPTMKAVIQPPERELVKPAEVPLDLFLSYLSGGPAGQAPVRLRTLVQPRAIRFDGYDDYVFGGEAVREGIGLDAEAAETGDGAERKPADVRPLTLDAQGAGRVAIGGLPGDGKPAELIAEMEYQDANGELEAVSRRIPLWPAEVNLGIRADGWVTSRDQVRFRVAALDLKGKPVAGQTVRVRLFSRKTYSWRKRLIGGFYAYDNRHRVTPLDAVCEGGTDATGLLSCEVRPGAEGEILIQASTRDRHGNEALSVSSAWVAGKDDTWFEGGDTDRMDLIPERQEYEPGETARFQVRMPFREATAWVTVEREGVAATFITPLSGKHPTIEVPLRGEYAPNVFVSALVVRGRVEPGSPWWSGIAEALRLPVRTESIPAPTALADLGKPAYRLGNAGIRVGWRARRLDVSVEPAAAVYRPRETARVRVRVGTAEGGPPPADAEVAVAAVDEALLSLKPNPSWNLLDAMMASRPIEVQTSTAQMQVVGKRHFGRKALPHGGGGGRQAARELFDTLLLWKGRLPLNGRDELDLDIPLNDSLSAFRVVAVAHAGLDRFGTGSGGFRTSQPLMLNSGLPPLVREGDRFSARFTLRNASDASIGARVAASVTVDPPGEPAAIEAPPQTLELPAGGARVAEFPIEVPANARRLRWEVVAVDAAGQPRDRLKVEQAVLPAVPIRTVQATLEQVAGVLGVEVQNPAGALPGRGGVEVELRPRLGDALGGVRDYMRSYPYACLEQRVSVAIALGDGSRWAELMSQLPVYLDRDGLLKYFPGDGLTGSDVLTSYVLAIATEAGRELPEAPRRKLLAGLKDFVGGRVLRDSLPRAPDLTLRKLTAIEALARVGEATPEMLGSLTLDPNAWPTSALLDWIGILQRVEGIPDREARQREALQLLKARLTYHGSVLAFSTEARDRLGWLMLSGDVNAARLILTALRTPAWLGETPRLARGALGRLDGGHWNMTTANAWGALALAKFSERFESAPVTGDTTATLGLETRALAWAGRSDGGRLELPLPAAPQTLALRQSGTGRPWALVQVKAALPLARPLTAGFRLERRVEPVEQRNPGRWTRGDILRVTLDMDAQSDLPWVVVDDPVPAGATVLGKGLGQESGLLTRGETQSSQVWPAWEERRHDAWRAYYAFVPKGRWSASYTLRLNNPGTFHLPATHIEALYAPEAFADYPNAPIEVAAP